VKTSVVVAIVVGVLVAFASVAAATGYIWSQTTGTAPPSAAAQPVAWPSKDGQALRAVAIPAGDLVAALPPDARGQVLCQALSQERWNGILGGTTQREVRDDGCHLVTTTLDLSLSLDQAPAGLRAPKPVDIAGHPGELEFFASGNARLEVRLVTATATTEITPYLLLSLSSTADQPALDGLITTVGRAVVAATMSTHEPLPPAGPDRTIASRQVPPVPGHGIVDAPWPLISWQLCTELTRVLGGSPKAYFAGRCTVRGITATYTDTVSPRRYPDQVAGRPALVTDSLVAIKLTDDSVPELTLTGSGRSLKQLAETVLPALLGHA
jgi:hypothetical protein